MAQIREELILVDRFTSAFTSYLRQTGRAAEATELAKNSARQLSQEQQKMGQQTNALTGRIQALAGAYVGIQGLSQLVGAADALASTTARIDMMNDGLQTTEELTDMIYESAQRARGSYQGTEDMVAKLGTLAGDAFSSSAEVVAFAEQINKQMALSGATSVGRDAAMLQLTQAMSSGVLRGEELNSILEQTPTIAQTIAEYLGVTTGEMRELASEGKVTAEVVKNAMFAAADETNAAFTSMPMTWAQVWTSLQNTMLKTFEPLLKVVGQLANFIGEHLEGAIAVFYGLAAAVAFYTVAQWLATVSVKAFFTALVSNPIGWIAVAIGALVGLIYKWIQSVGGLKAAWQIVVDAVLYHFDLLKIGFYTGVYAVQTMLDLMALKFLTVKINIQNAVGDMKVGVLTILQDMVNGAIDILNWFITRLNKIPGVSIDAIDKMTFATTAAAKNEAEKSARSRELAAAQQEVEAQFNERREQLATMVADREADHATRLAGIQETQATAAAKAAAGSDTTNGTLGEIAGGVGSIEKSVSMAEEDIKSLVDIAERKYINQINLTSQTPVINVTGQNTGNTAADRTNLANALRDILIEQVASGSVRSTARAY